MAGVTLPAFPTAANLDGLYDRVARSEFTKREALELLDAVYHMVRRIETLERSGDRISPREFWSEGLHPGQRTTLWL